MTKQQLEKTIIECLNVINENKEDTNIWWIEHRLKVVMGIDD